jgi:hypothetical protein
MEIQMNEATKPNLQTVQKLADTPPPELVSLADSLMATMAMHQLKAEAVEAYSTNVLAKMQAKISSKWVELGVEDQLILSPKDAFLLDDVQSARYYALCEEERISAGLKVDREGNCPALEAEGLFRVARDAFIDALTPYTTISLDQARMSSTLDKLADWGLKILAKHVDPHKRFGIPKC